jgi:hypothetical protein
MLVPIFFDQYSYILFAFWQVDRGQAYADAMFQTAGSIFKRECPSCVTSHKFIFYKRITAVPSSFSVYNNMKELWSSADNILNTDFELYSSWNDLQSGMNAWQYCSFDDTGVAFPGNCQLTVGQTSEQVLPLSNFIF